MSRIFRLAGGISKYGIQILFASGKRPEETESCLLNRIGMNATCVRLAYKKCHL